MLVHGWLGGDVFGGLVVGVEEIVFVWIAIKLEHLSLTNFAVVLPLLRATYSPAAVEGIMMRSV